MSTQQNANGTIPQATNPAQVAIVSSTNATPIVVTTGTHGYATGDTVEIEGHVTNTAANGLWSIIVLSPTTFSLTGSTGNGVGGATGYCIDHAVNPLITLPADLVDPLNASSINPAIAGVFNAVPYLYRRVGKYCLFDEQILVAAGETATNPTGTGFGSTTSLTTGTWTKITGTDATYPNAVKSGDILDISLCCQDLSVATNLFGVGIGAAINGGATQILGAFDTTGLPCWFTGGAFAPIKARYIGSVKTSALPITNGGLVLSAMGAQFTGGSVNMTLCAPYWIEVKHYRSNA